MEVALFAALSFAGPSFLISCFSDPTFLFLLSSSFSATTGLPPPGRVKDACVSHLASGRPLPAVEALHLAQHRSLAARLLPLLQEQEQDTVSSCLQEAFRMEDGGYGGAL